MDFAGIKLEDAVPLMHNIELALADKKVERVLFKDDDDLEAHAVLSRQQAETLLTDLEKHFFAQAD